MEVSLLPQAIKQYKRLNNPLLSRVKNALDNLELDPPKGDIRPLTGTNGFFRLFVGGVRILYTIENNEIFVTDIVPRGQAYTKKTMEGKK